MITSKFLYNTVVVFLITLLSAEITVASGRKSEVDILIGHKIFCEDTVMSHCKMPHCTMSGCAMSVAQLEEPKKKNLWKKLIPDYQKIQFAGSMGLLSVGTGWEYGRSHWETDILFGILPKYRDIRAKAIFTLKQNYIPWGIRLKENKWVIEPLTTGLYLTTLLDNRFWIKEPHKYPHGYYPFFETRVRLNVFLGQRLVYNFTGEKWKGKSITVFYEFSTNDLFLTSAFKNHEIGVKDILSLSFGIKLKLY